MSSPLLRVFEHLRVFEIRRTSIYYFRYKMAAFCTMLALILIALSAFSISEALMDRGVCLGMNGDNLPSASDMVRLYTTNNISRIRLFEPYPEVLQALRGSQILVTLGVRNEDLPTLASSQDAAQTWYDTNVKNNLDAVLFQYISVGNEVIFGESSQLIAAAMQNLQTVIDASPQGQNIKVTTAIAANALGASYPPSSGAFTDEAKATMISVLQFLSAHQSPLMINAYPYWSYASDPANIPLNYALFNATEAVQDGALSYFNLFDAIVDAFHSAMEREGVTDVGVMVSESGWPSDGNGNITTPEIAAAYNSRFVSHVLNFGTPKRPTARIPWFVFAMFEENLKTDGVEQHFGLYHADMTPAYSDIFSST